MASSIAVRRENAALCYRAGNALCTGTVRAAVSWFAVGLSAVRVRHFAFCGRCRHWRWKGVVGVPTHFVYIHICASTRLCPLFADEVVIAARLACRRCPQQQQLLCKCLVFTQRSISCYVSMVTCASRVDLRRTSLRHLTTVWNFFVAQFDVFNIYRPILTLLCSRTEQANASKSIAILPTKTVLR